MKHITTLTILSVCLFLSACDTNKPWLMEPSKLVAGKIALVESRYIAKKPLAAFTTDDATAAAKNYKRQGAGPLYLVVAHNDVTKGNVSTRTTALAKALEHAGVNPRDIITSTVPLTTSTPIALTLEAQKPTGCTMGMPGVASLTGQESDFNYKLGCGVKENMAKQIANPKDLKGVAGLGGTGDGERAANIINTTLKSGTPRPFLPSYIISELAGSGN
jgi:type IV pilus biogenesis protein CpaD/CtpE